MIIVIVCSAVILALVCMSIYGIFFGQETSSSHYNPYDDELTTAIIQLISDCYSPIVDVRLNNRLSTDLDLDMLDIADLLFDVSKIAETEVSLREFVSLYGKDPTVAQLSKYVRSTIHTN